MWTHFSCNFLHEISLVADWVFESRPMQLHSSYACNGLISWRIGSLHPGHALSIYFVILLDFGIRGESLIYLSLSLQRRLTWCPGVTRSAATVDCNRSDGGKRVGFFMVRAWFICHSLCRGDWLGTQVSLSIAIGVMAERELASSRWELDLFFTLSAEAIDLVPRCRCR